MLEGMLDESTVTLQEALGARKTFMYVYDFGDDWHHKIKVEKIITLDAPLSLAVCLDGENACPPEDVGGSPGYEEFLQALADPAHPDHGDLKDWIGGSFDPAAFSIAEVNARLKQAAICFSSRGPGSRTPADEVGTHFVNAWLFAKNSARLTQR